VDPEVHTNVSDTQAVSSALKMQKICFSEKLVSINKSTRRHNPEEQPRNLHRRENVTFRPEKYLDVAETKWATGSVLK
jgi:hypothetical protein